jgi:hypothetical protein
VDLAAVEAVNPVVALYDIPSHARCHHVLFVAHSKVECSWLKA